MTAGYAELPTALVGTLLAYGSQDSFSVAVPDTSVHPRAGLVLAGADVVPTIRRLHAGKYSRPLAFDIKLWADQVATVDSPMAPPEADSLFAMSLDDWAAAILAVGATAVFTPSKFVQLADWPALKAVVQAGNEASVLELITLIATDAAMLDEAYRGSFLEMAAQSTRPTAFLFAAGNTPLANWGRAKGLRELFLAMPGCLLLGTEVLAATDALAHGAGAAAIGVTGSLRRPRRPGDPGGGGNNAVAGVPGLFLRDLWEQRSPGIYADWYANSRSPVCAKCGAGEWTPSAALAQRRIPSCVTISTHG
jgi:hypothetical protein